MTDCDYPAFLRPFACKQESGRLLIPLLWKHNKRSLCEAVKKRIKILTAKLQQLHETVRFVLKTVSSEFQNHGQLPSILLWKLPDKIGALRQQARGVKATPISVGTVITWCNRTNSFWFLLGRSCGAVCSSTKACSGTSVSGAVCTCLPDGPVTLWPDGWSPTPKNPEEEEPAAKREPEGTALVWTLTWSTWTAVLASAQDLVLGTIYLLFCCCLLSQKLCALAQPLMIIRKDLV